jgi:HEAT repeat protein
LVLHDDPAFQDEIIPLLDDKNEPVRLRAAAGYLRLETIRDTKPRKRPARKLPPKSQS